MDIERDDALLAAYREHAVSDLLPFWWKAVDTQHGGIFTCFDNAGVHLVSRRKYTWSQGRFVWLWSRAARMITASMLPGDAAAYLREAARTVEFLNDNVFLPNGNCAYVLSEAGDKVEGDDSDTSIYADCFVLLGFAEYALVARDSQVLQRAFQVYERIRARLASGSFRTEPYPIPSGYRSHSIAMILLRVTQILADAADALDHERSRELTDETIRCASEVLHVFVRRRWPCVRTNPNRRALEGYDTCAACHAWPHFREHVVRYADRVAARTRRVDRARLSLHRLGIRSGMG